MEEIKILNFVPYGQEGLRAKTIVIQYKEAYVLRSLLTSSVTKRIIIRLRKPFDQAA